MQIKQLWRYPVKGLNGELLPSVKLLKEFGIRGDRQYALLFNDRATTTDRAIPWVKKQNFANQNDWPGLAVLKCSFDSKARLLSIMQENQVQASGNLDREEGRQKIDQFFTSYLKTIAPSSKAGHPLNGPVHIVGGAETRYADRNAIALSIVNQNSLEDLIRLTGEPIDMQSFRGNIIIGGIPAWKELDWIGKEIRLGSAKLGIKAPIGRCLNINVDPNTAAVNPKILATLAKFNQGKFGVMADVTKEGEVQVGDAIAII